MARTKTLQTNFSAGELAPELAMRADTEQYQNGAKSLRNRRCLIGGGTSRRPGTKRLAVLQGPSRFAEWVVNQSTQYVIVFSSGRMDAYLRDGTASGALTGCPWTGAIWEEMDFVQSANTMFVVHRDMPIQIITRTGSASFSRATLTFLLSGPRTEQPYFKVAASAMTLQPSALTGSITLTASAALFKPAHVGQVIRYLGREMLITAEPGTGLTATATVLESLPGTYTLTVTSSADFTIGESVQGATSGAKAIVAGVPDATHLTVYLRNISDSTTTTSGGPVLRRGDEFAQVSLEVFQAETLIGPRAKTTISASVAATAAAVTDWDEQIFGPVYGYPACVELHRNRLLFGGHPAAPDLLFGSRLNNFYSFNVGDASDADAIIESIGDSSAAEIRQLFSAEQLIIGTDRGLYYVPESKTSPFRPTSISFVSFGSPWAITPEVKMRAFDNGVLAVSGSLIIKARPTGDNERAWVADEVSLLSPHLIDEPVALAVTTNFGGGPERYAAAVNADGTIAVMQLIEAQKIRNFTPWDSGDLKLGFFTATAALGSDLFVAVRRIISGVNRYWLERFDVELTLDAATVYATKALMDADVVARYGSNEVKVVSAEGYSLGVYPPTIATLPDAPYTVGFDYETEIEILPPVIEDARGSHAGDLMRITEALVFVRGSARFAADGHELTAYQTTDPLDEPPPLKEGAQRFTFLGWEREPTIIITQPDPLDLTVLAIRTEIAY